MKRILWIALATGFLNLGACAFLPVTAPNDLKLDSVSLIDTKNLSPSEQRDISSYKFNSLPRQVLKVKFTSNSNLVEQRKNWNDTYIQTAACRDWKDIGKMVQDSSGGYVPAGPIGMATSSVYWKSIDVLNIIGGEELPGKEAFVYHFYMDIIRQDYRAGYDLSIKPEDVCFQITSAEMLRRGARTNIVTIPKEAIAMALQKHAR